LIQSDGKQVGLIGIQEALKMAGEVGLDLVEVAPDATPPVCKIMDLRKLLFERKKKLRESRKKSKTLELKEIKVRPTIDPHDYLIKVKHAREFLEKGHKVRITLMLRGRENVHQSLMDQIINKFIADTQDIAISENERGKEAKIRALILSKK